MRKLYSTPLFRLFRSSKATMLVLSLVLLFSSKEGRTQSGVSLFYDGSNDFVALPDNILNTVNQDFTIEAWVFWRNGSAYQRIFDFGAGTENWMFLTPSTGGTSPVARFAITTTGLTSPQILDADIPVSPNVWTHIAVTIEHETNMGRIFINGTERGSATITLRASDLGNTNQNWLGLSRYLGIYGDPYYNGNIDELRISNSLRYSSNFTAPVTAFSSDGSTVALYHFNDGSGQSATDASANGYTALLGGTALPESSDPAWTSSSILPVKLTDLTIRRLGNNIHLNWNAAVTGEGGNFEIERSADGLHFSTIGRVQITAQAGTFSYHYTDVAPRNGKNFYRIRIAEPNAAAEYTSILFAEFGGKRSYSAYPTLVRSEIYADILSPVTVSIYNTSGLLVKRVSLKTSQMISVDLLPKGNYILQFEGTTEKVRFIKE